MSSHITESKYCTVTWNVRYGHQLKAVKYRKLRFISIIIPFDLCILKCDNERFINDVFLGIGVVRSVRPSYLADCRTFMDEQLKRFNAYLVDALLMGFPGMIHDERLNMYRRISPVFYLWPNYSGDWLLHLLWNSPSLILFCPWSADHLPLIHYRYIPCVSLISNRYEN